MDEAEVIERVALIAHDQTSEIAEPCPEPFDLPAATLAAQRTSILRLGTDAPAAMGSDHLDAPPRQGPIESIRIIGAITNQALGQGADEAGVEGGGDEGNFMRRSRGGTDGERKTKAVCQSRHCHELRTFAPLGRSHAAAPFFATINVPSMKHSERSRPPRSLRSCASASRMRSRVRSRTQRWKRRWQVWYGGYRPGRSAHWAPVRRIHRMPFNTSRLLRQGRPRPSARRGSSPINGSRTAHCSSVRSIATSSYGMQLTTHL